MKDILKHRYVKASKETAAGWMAEPESLRRFLRESQPGQIILCLILGNIVGAIVAVMHNLVQFMHRLTFALANGEHLSSGKNIDMGRLIFVPALGGLALALFVWISRKIRSREIIDPIEANAIYGGRMSFGGNIKLMSECFISNSVGASVGMEAAYTQVGSGLLSWFGEKLQLRREDLRIFVAAGAAAAIAAAFNAPLAGAFYGFEIILSSYTITALPQVALCALASVLFTRVFTNAEPIFSLPASTIDIPNWDYPIFFLMGIGAAMLGIVTMKLVTKCESLARLLPIPRDFHPIIAGILLSAIAFLFPQVLGSGQGAINDNLNQDWPLIILLLLIVAKVFASAFSIGLGFRGGLFSTSLFIGSLFGHACGIIASYVLPQSAGQIESFILVGMGAVAASIIGAPVTMILLVLEMTGNYQATTGVLFGVLIASAITRYSFGYSFSTWRFHLRGIRIHSAQDISWVSDLKVSKIMRADARTIPLAMSIAELRRFAPPGSGKSVFVVDAENNYQGTIDVPAIHDAVFDKNEATMLAKDVAKAKDSFLLPDNDIAEALKMFETSKIEELPVLAAADNANIIGYLTEAYALRRYAQELEAKNLSHSFAGSPANSR